MLLKYCNYRNNTQQDAVITEMIWFAAEQSRKAGAQAISIDSIEWFLPDINFHVSVQKGIMPGRTWCKKAARSSKFQAPISST